MATSYLQSAKGLCCVCLVHPLEQLHHAKYGCDRTRDLLVVPKSTDIPRQ
ncbi:MAG: hypothetical protein V7K89_15355 [Nostoc sp.]